MKTLILRILAATCLLAASVNAQSLLVDEQETSAQGTARMLLAAPKEIRNSVLQKLDFTSKTLWESSNPQDVLDALGTKAGALFALNESFLTVLASFLTAEGDSDGLLVISAIQARTPAHTVNGDGTITIDVP